MSNRLEELEIDVQAVEWDAKSSVGVGQHYISQANEAADSEDGGETKYLAAATAFRRAACHYLSLDQPEKAANLFSRAANAYYRTDNAYAYLLAALTDEETDLPSSLEYFKSPGNDSDAASWANSPDEERFPRRITPNSIYAALDLVRQRDYRAEYESIPKSEQFAAKRSSGLGTLGLPLDTYLNLAQLAIRVPPGGREVKNVNEQFAPLREEARQVLTPLLSAYSNALSQAQQNSYHWKRLAMPFHPAEPDILGPLVMLREPLEMIDFDLVEELAGTPISGESRRVLGDFLNFLTR